MSIRYTQCQYLSNLGNHCNVKLTVSHIPYRKTTPSESPNRICIMRRSECTFKLACSTKRLQVCVCTSACVYFVVNLRLNVKRYHHLACFITTKTRDGTRSSDLIVRQRYDTANFRFVSLHLTFRLHPGVNGDEIKYVQLSRAISINISPVSGEPHRGRAISDGLSDIARGIERKQLVATRRECCK